MHKYRTHNCQQLRISDVGNEVKLSGFVHRRRDHGGLVFIDLRDHFGITQLLFDDQNIEIRDAASYFRYESVITIIGEVVARSEDAINKEMPTGEIEVKVKSYIVESEAAMLPLSVNSDQEAPEETRLKYRFLDLRRKKLHDNIILRSSVISEIRKLMTDNGFTEFQTPILTASSPEGARDFLVPSRLNPGKFYALPQAPQQFKQMLMMSGFDKYFQIAPCFRDEDARADRSPGEFYQLDMEMSFATQEDVFAAIEPVMYSIFTKFSKKKVSTYPFPRISYDEAMLKYGCDKPDLRNPIILHDTSEIFKDSNFTIFKQNIAAGSVVRAIAAPAAANKSRKFFDDMIKYAADFGSRGLAYIQFSEELDEDNNPIAKGPIAKFLNSEQLSALREQVSLKPGDAVFFACAKESSACKIASAVRNKLGLELDLINQDVFEFCWITDFPYYEQDEDTGKIEFSHNPFSMPQGGLEALEKAQSIDQLLKIKAFQYDIVCNGIELSSGAVRNHKPELMYKAFDIAGYNKEEVDREFGGMIRAFTYGAPPHAGIAPGIDRIVMLLADEPNIRQVIAFPMNQQAQDLLMDAPSSVSPEQLRELNIMLSPSVKAKLEKKETT